MGNWSPRPRWRLIWLELQQSWPLLATLGGIYALASGWYAIRFGHQGLEPIVVMLVVLGALHGGCVFLGDKQGDRYRFFAEHGIKPGQVWLTRQTVWIAALACWTLLTTAVGTYMVSDHTPNDAKVYVALWLGLTLLAYTVGQLCSTFFRSGILANTIGIPAAALLCGWALLMFVFQVNPALSVAPLPLALLLATRLRANDWIVDRFVWRARVRAAASVVLPVGLVFAAVIWLRVAEYPNEGPGFDVQEFARPITAEERATADLYRKAWSSLGPLWHESETALSPLVGPTQAREADRETQGSRSTDPKGAPEPSEENATSELNGETQPEMLLSTMEAWVDKHQDELQIALQASRMRDCVFGKLTGHFNHEEVLRSARLGALFYWSGRIREEQGDPDKAFESYLAALRYAKHLRVRATVWDASTAIILERRVLARLPQWVIQSDMTSQQVLLARSRIDEVLDTMPNKSEAYKASYLIAKQTLTDDARYAQVVFESIPNRTRAMALLILKRLMPWEIARARRVMDSVVHEELEQWQANRNAIDRLPPTLFASSPHVDTAMRTTPVLWEIFEPYELRLFDGLGDEREQTARRRATHLVLALQAAHIDKGDLPATLEELVGDYVDEIPLDPYVGQPFRHLSKGVSFSLSYRAFNTMDPTYPTSILPGQAFVWSAQNSFEAVRSSSADREGETDDKEYLHLGRAYPIPTHADGP